MDKINHSEANGGNVVKYQLEMEEAMKRSLHDAELEKQRVREDSAFREAQDNWVLKLRENKVQ